MVASLATTLGCGTPPAALLSVTADGTVDQYDLYVRDDNTSQIIFHSGFNPVQVPGEKPRDLTKDSLRIAVKLSRSGRFTILLVGISGELIDGKPGPSATQYFWATRTTIDESSNISARLLTVPPEFDLDRDLWPEKVSWVAASEEARRLYGDKPHLLDCNDAVEAGMEGNPTTFKPGDINPFAVEVCGDGYDENCNGDSDEKCVDEDKDGDPSITDCDDKDPKRHRATAADPFPDPPNCCGYNLGLRGTAEENVNKLGDETLCPGMKPRCGNGVDESCRGADTTCVVDDDCDGYPAKPQGNDCDDADPAVHPNALEPCGQMRDLNCDGVIGGGCVPCDLDGDKFQRNDPANGCPDSKDENPGKFDCNDYDASVYPGATAPCGNTEAGVGAIGKLQCSLRGGCRRIYESTGMTGTPKISLLGWLVGDNDCNGVAYEGCPPMACDADGDGWPVDNMVCAAVEGKFDCDDGNPTIYPGAPVSCGTGAAENCTDQKQPCSSDADRDGWNAGPDCDDNNAAVHPWAPELCDGLDNDCDSERDSVTRMPKNMIDEGNPDPMGKPMITNNAVTTCTDSNVGECAKTLGTCVCSIAQPMSSINGSNRNPCPGEAEAAAKPARCFGAGQPHPQSCDATSPRDDDCDSRNDDPEGANLAVKGLPCGVNGPAALSQCKAGIVTGCDSMYVNPFVTFSLSKATETWYVCSADTVLPQAELCNGLDDDCDTTLPVNERDGDGDKYMACSGCGATLAPSVVGCDDCVDTDSTIYPNAPELCDNKNNKCDPAWSMSPNGADGTAPTAMGGCAGSATPDCCSNQSTCRNLSNDFNNCKGCGIGCTVNKADHCDATIGCACKTGAQCSQYQFCDPAGGKRCEPCNTNSFCGDTCGPCGVGQSCQVKASAPSGYSCGCTDDSGCPSGQYCWPNGSCQGRAPNGHTCTPIGGFSTICCSSDNPSTCRSVTGFCVDGVCCNNNCTTNLQCSSCNLAGSVGTCTALQSGQSPVGGRTCNPFSNSTCQGSCTGGADCAFPSSQCRAPSCTNTNRWVPGANCNTGNCPSAPAAVDCGSFLKCADSTACLTSCNEDADCMGDRFCNASGACQDRKGLNINCAATECYGGAGGCTLCQANLSCTSGQCRRVDGQACAMGMNGQCASNFCRAKGDGSYVCCATTCSGECALNCGGASGTCQFDPLGTPCGSGNQACPGNSETCTSGCSNDNQCAAGYWCYMGACIGCSSMSGGSCNSGQNCNGACGTTSYCPSGTCQPCNANGACSNGSSCVNCSGAAGNTDGHVCKNAGNAAPCGCNTSADCESGRWCNTSLNPAKCVACTSGAGPCGSGEACAGATGCGAAGTARRCNGTSCEDCNYNGHCGNSCNACPSVNNLCSGGLCTCNGDGNCGSGEYCRNDNSCQTRLADGASCQTCAVAGCLQCQIGSGSACQTGGRCGCDADSDCSPNSLYCKESGTIDICTMRIMSGQNCQQSNCGGGVTNCLQCASATPSPCPSPGPVACPS